MASVSKQEPCMDAPWTDRGHQAAFHTVCLLPALFESQAVGIVACPLASSPLHFADVPKAGPNPVHVPLMSSDTETRSQNLRVARCSLSILCRAGILLPRSNICFDPFQSENYSP